MNEITPTHRSGLVALAEGKRWLAEARDALQVLDLRNKAQAVEHYLKQRDDSDGAARDAAELRLRAERRLGELLAETVRKGRPEKMSHRATFLPPGVTRSDSSRYQQAALVPEEEFERHVEQARAERDIKGLTSAAVRRKAKQQQKQQERAAVAGEPAPLPTGPFRVIVADPPWSYDSRAEDPTHRAANPYASMTLDKIKAYLPATLPAPDSILWLWTTNAHMREAFEVLDAWGFRHKTILTWVKDRMGTGDWLRGQTEHCLLAVKGKPAVSLTNQTTVLHGPLREHSRKPEEFYALLETLCPGSKVELFARTTRPGWTTHGNQTDRFP